jgi:hypothetical protein
MSFNELDNLQDLEAQAGGFSDSMEPSAEFTHLVRAISQNIFHITSNVASIHRSVGLMGTPRDTDKMRSTLLDLLAKTRTVTKDTIPQIRSLSAWDPTEIGPSERYEQQKLTGDFQKAMTDFQNAQKLALEKEKDFVRGAKAAAGDEEGGEEGAVAGEASRPQERVQLMDNAEMAFNDQLIEERETEIQGIEQGIQELNEIFRDLATIVTEQGGMIGTGFRGMAVLILR